MGFIEFGDKKKPWNSLKDNYKKNLIIRVIF